MDASPPLSACPLSLHPHQALCVSLTPSYKNLPLSPHLFVYSNTYTQEAPAVSIPFLDLRLTAASPSHV